MTAINWDNPPAQWRIGAVVRDTLWFELAHIKYTNTGLYQALMVHHTTIRKHC